MIKVIKQLLYISLSLQTLSPPISTTLRTTAQTPTQRETPPITMTTGPKPLPRRRSEPALFPSASPPATRLHGGLLLARSHEDCSGFEERPAPEACFRRLNPTPAAGSEVSPRPLSGAAGAGSQPLPARWRAPSPTNQRARFSPARPSPLPRPPGAPCSPGNSPSTCPLPRRRRRRRRRRR